MRIIVTGGSGYKGAVLIPKLLEDGHDIVCIDTFWFGDHLEDNH
ncbi:NAD-dependent epimerase/dehydratase family protein [Prochlorococcus sp. AH-716-B23]|nr:NAD-dependent epimerase/dehydratase family protein [Prochlorococcus sp. AH-716-B23]